jgi:hypothetical protein
METLQNKIQDIIDFVETTQEYNVYLINKLKELQNENENRINN